MFLHHKIQRLTAVIIIKACQTNIWAESNADGNDKPINNRLVVLTRFTNDRITAPKTAPHSFWKIVDGKAIIPAKRIDKNGRLVHSSTIVKARGPLVTTLSCTDASMLSILTRNPVASAFQWRIVSACLVSENLVYNQKNTSRLIPYETNTKRPGRYRQTRGLARRTTWRPIRIGIG